MNIQNILSGFILRPARSGNSNTKTTSTATSGVVRHFEEWSNSDQTMLTEIYGSQYRCAFIEGGERTEEYLLWASDNGSSYMGDAAVQETNEHQNFRDEDGVVRKILVTDPDGREIVEMLEVFISADGFFQTLQNNIHYYWDGEYIHITQVGESQMNGGFQPQRGDYFSSAAYKVAKMGFYWV